MNIRLVIAALLFCLAMLGCIAANLIYFSMLREINKLRLDHKQLSYFGFRASLNFFNHLNEYRTLFPNGRLRVRLRIAYAVMFVGFLTSCFMLRFQ